MKAQYQDKLSSLPLGSFRYYNTIGSTNDEALAWASKGAPDLSLIVADEQTSGRGRMDQQMVHASALSIGDEFDLAPHADREHASFPDNRPACTIP